MKARKQICEYCNIEFDEDDYPPCDNATAASSCRWNHPPKFKLQVVGENFQRIEDDPVRLRALQGLINDGMAWHPDIDADGFIGRIANDLIDRKICKPPRTEEAARSRHMFVVCQRFGLSVK